MITLELLHKDLTSKTDDINIYKNIIESHINSDMSFESDYKNLLVVTNKHRNPALWENLIYDDNTVYGSLITDSKGMPKSRIYYKTDNKINKNTKKYNQALFIVNPKDLLFIGRLDTFLNKIDIIVGEIKRIDINNNIISLKTRTLITGYLEKSNIKLVSKYKLPTLILIGKLVLKDINLSTYYIDTIIKNFSKGLSKYLYNKNKNRY